MIAAIRNDDGYTMSEQTYALPLTGGCQCGAVRYEITQAPVALYACHCTECRHQSGSAFGLSLIVPREGFSTNGATLATWQRPTDQGRRLDCHFCPTCGARLWHETVPNKATLSLKAGTLDEPIDLTHAVHIWTKRKLNGVVLPEGAKSFPGEPE
jgi:hypothetical protein